MVQFFAKIYDYALSLTDIYKDGLNVNVQFFTSAPHIVINVNKKRLPIISLKLRTNELSLKSL